MGEFFIQVITCKGRVAESAPPSGRQFDHWATMADMLLTGQPLPVKIEEANEHPVKVTLAFEGDDLERPTSVASVFLLCPCDIEVIAGERVQSALLNPQPNTNSAKIQTPRLIIP